LNNNNGTNSVNYPLAMNNNSLSIAVRVFRISFTMVILLSFSINLLMLTAPLYMLQVYDRVLSSRSFDTLYFLTLMAGFAFFTLALLEVVRNIIVIRIGNWIEERLGGEIYTFGVMQSLNRGASPSIQGLRDFTTVRGFLTGPALFPILDVPWTPIFIGIIFLLHPMLGWLSLGGAILLLFLAFLNEYLNQPKFEKAGECSRAAMLQAESAVRNSDSVEAMGMMPGLVNRWRRSRADETDFQSQAMLNGGVIRAIVRFVRLGLQIALLGLGCFLVISSELTAGAMIAGAILLGRALAPIDQSITSWRTSIAARGAYSRLKMLYSSMPLRGSGMPLPSPRGDISVENLSYGLPGQSSLILKGISFSLPAGTCLGLIGPTAAGKSTLARLLVGTLNPIQGCVRLDGMDISKWEPDDRGRHVGYLPQDVELFDASVRENIARMEEGAPEQVVAAARTAFVHELIMRLPHGYDTVIGERGAILSGGQQQRIALGRALYGAPKLVVLDEPAANLDQEGELALVSTLKGLKKRGVTTVVIAHRPNLLRDVDYVLVLRNGTVTMFGPRDDVLSKFAKPHEVRPVRSAES